MAEASIRSALGVHSGVSTAGTMPPRSRSHAYLAAVDRAATLLAEADAARHVGLGLRLARRPDDVERVAVGLPRDRRRVGVEELERAGHGHGRRRVPLGRARPAAAHRRDRGMGSERAGGRAAPQRHPRPGRARRGSDRQPRSATSATREDGSRSATRASTSCTAATRRTTRPRCGECSAATARS